MNQLDIIQALGEDTILLTRPDSWLDQKRKSVSDQLSILIEELKAIEKAQEVKRKLQDKNLVAVKHWKDDDEVIEIMGLREAVTTLEADEHAYDQIGQLNVWKIDGYDVETARVLTHS